MDTLLLDGRDIDMPFLVGLKQLELAKEISTPVTQNLLDDIEAYKTMLRQPKAIKESYLKIKKLQQGLPPRLIVAKLKIT